MKQLRLYWLLFPALLGLTACELINPAEELPAYLYVAPFTVATDEFSQGSSNDRITEGWVFVDGVFLGAYDLPATIPVLAEGSTEIRVEAGIRENGISRTPDIYLFYQPFTATLDLQPLQTDTLRPATRYTDDTKVAFVEDFEDTRSRVFTQVIIGEGEPLQRTQEVVFEGSYSGKITLTEDQPVVEIATSRSFRDLLENNIYVFLEVNYRSEAPVVWGVVGRKGLDQVRAYDPGFSPKAEWNKIYFNLSGVIFDSQLEEYNIALQAFLGEGEPPADIYLDNIKLLHF